MKIILGSQSPQRLKLLRPVAGTGLIVMPPTSDAEPGFETLHMIAEIEGQLERIVSMKFDDVAAQVSDSELSVDECCIICADTVVVATSSDGLPLVLGKPPEKNWEATVRNWFNNYYAKTPHEVWTAFRIGVGKRSRQEIVKTQIVLRRIDAALLDWYISTKEPVGKAGGYGIQGIASMFVESMQGSLSNVVGLPMFEVTAALRNLDVISISES